jgi:hypothetical protein
MIIHAEECYAKRLECGPALALVIVQADKKSLHAPEYGQQPFSEVHRTKEQSGNSIPPVRARQHERAGCSERNSTTRWKWILDAVIQALVNA